jgi:glutamate-ammonia-ligase adenylyltransferase
MVPADETWPEAADAAAAARLAERFAALGSAEARLARTPRAAAVLDAVGGNSPFLSELLLREPATFRAVLTEGPGPAYARALERLAQTGAAARTPLVSAALRRARRQVALTVALADIGGAWGLDRVTGALSFFAEAALRLAVDHLLLAAAARRELTLASLAEPGPGSGFIVLGMGKLGARELNYSSDIDLVLIYDPAPHLRAGADSAVLATCFTRLAQGLVSLMQHRDAEGYVFRTDLRLRPDPAATPPAISLPAALTYYESMGQNWERAAMVKARPLAGDVAAGAQFLEAIRPFVWRKGLDFAAVADIAAMKRRIDAQRGAGARPSDRVAAIGGFNLKLGQGGIREIEFLAQTLQLVWGGRDPGLRVPETLGALRALARAGHVPRAAAQELAAAYAVLRALEHRLQMVADRQTHSLPDGAAALDRFAVFFGLADAGMLAETVLRQISVVRRHYAELFETVPDPGPGAGLDFSGPDAHPATLAQLLALGFTQGAAIVDAVHGWQAGRVRALRSERARALVGEMLPALLAALARQDQPDAAFARFDQLLGRLPAGVQLLSMLAHNPALLDRVAMVLGAAPFLADHLAQSPQALEGLVAPVRQPGPARLLRERLSDAATLEDTIAVIRRTRVEVDFSLSVATLEGTLDADGAGLARTKLADAAIGALLPLVLDDVERRFGTVRGGGLVVVALGKAGSREMMAGSDLDLMLIYDHGPGVTESQVPAGRGGRAVPVAQYYGRVAQAFIGALTAPGAEGPIYPVDMRLRPSGNAGPVAVSLAAFRRYHRENAWTWERMAVTRGRVVAGPAILSARVADALLTVVEYAGLAPGLAADAAAMRARLARDLPARTPWDVKHRLGGLMEVEFIAQVLQLMHAGRHPGIASPTTRIALRRLRDAGLLGDDDMRTLVEADRLWRTVQGMLRVTVGRPAERTLPAASAGALLRAVGRSHVGDQAALHREMDTTGEAVRAVFERLVGRPDPALLEKSS